MARARVVFPACRGPTTETAGKMARYSRIRVSSRLGMIKTLQLWSDIPNLQVYCDHFSPGQFPSATPGRYLAWAFTRATTSRI